MIHWLQEILMKLYLMDRPVVHRNKKDRRKADRRWSGPEGDLPKAGRIARRKGERRKKKRR